MRPPEPATGIDRENYVRSTARRLWDNLPLVVLAGLVFSLASTPAFLVLHTDYLFAAIVIGILTVAPAWTALLALESVIAADMAANIRTMLQAFPRYWSRSIRLGLLMAVPLAIFVAVLPRLGQPEVPFAIWLTLAGILFGLFLAVALCLYAFPLLAQYDLQPGLALRNAYILVTRHIGDTMGLLSMGVLFGFAVAVVGPALLLFLPAIWGLFIVSYCTMAVSEEMAGTP